MIGTQEMLLIRRGAAASIMLMPGLIKVNPFRNMVAWSWGNPLRAHMHYGVGPTPELTCPHPSRHVGPADPGGLGIQPLLLLLPSLSLSSLLIVKGIVRFTLQLSPSIRLPWLILADQIAFFN
jgi:hypothetical protein